MPLTKNMLTGLAVNSPAGFWFACFHALSLWLRGQARERLTPFTTQNRGDVKQLDSRFKRRKTFAYKGASTRNFQFVTKQLKLEGEKRVTNELRRKTMGKIKLGHKSPCSYSKNTSVD